MTEKILKLISNTTTIDYLLLIGLWITNFLGTRVGVYTFTLMHSHNHKLTKNQVKGLSMLASFVAMGINYKFSSEIALVWSFLLCIGTGYMLPFFRGWLDGKKIVRIFTKSYLQTKDFKSSVIENIDKELDKELES